ncbi:PqiB family protein [Jannaschia rubra]|uniref:Paraquat-inducible protein B n=1 Tax=Jannaschia rubra TaxID=282197 RepID=A0A0M6XTR4_9RHOB|nr:MlaD family protein [Jannaschia rubra]CTQ33621.1 Paraquat-inducible protein B [Jannaschia rubra]SFG05076.1 paraquat-inducible protein B [Jannaschia rubra]
MTDPSDRPATPVAERTGRRGGMVSAVWLVPIVAILVALAIAWQSWSDRGVLISVAFPDASGVTAGQTTLRYRDVTVGVVEDVGFTADLSQVNVFIRVNNSIAPYLDDDASFWVVQPEVSARGVQGLNTILSGTYIQGTWDSTMDEAKTAFIGDERAPIVPPGVRGTAITLRAQDSSRLGSGAPILYRGIEVGEVAAPRLTADGSEVRVDAFIRAPYDRQLSTATRFWDASGVTATLGAGGVELRIGSIASILEGGVNFDTLISGGEPIRPGHVYDIYEDETAARASTFETPDRKSILLGAVFPSAASGLTDGAAVRYQGVTVGRVTSITGFIRPDDPDGQVQLLAVLALQPAQMGLEMMSNDLDGIDFIDGLVAEGMRAKLVSTSLLGGDLAIELVDDPEVAAAPGLEIGVAANPLIPTVPADIQGLTASAESVLERINDLPIEELLASATNLLDSANRIASDEATREIPSEVLGLVRDGRAIVASPQVASVLLDIETITGDLRDLTQTLTESGVAASLAETIETAGAAAASLADGTANLPTLAASAERVMAEAETLGANLNRLSVKANDLALDRLVNSTTQLMTTADAFLSSDEADDVPVVLAQTLEEMRLTLETIRTGGTLDNLNSTLRSTASAADSLRVASGDLPALVARFTALGDQAGGMLEAYGQGSRINTELYSALRAAVRAAEDVSSLSRTIERNPNSLLLGR